jgi:hypothetical protein
MPKGLGFTRVQGLREMDLCRRVWGSVGFRVQGSASRGWGSGIGVLSLDFGIWDLGFKM